ncbi:MAG: hypothetical protein JNK78_04655 [Planctomycetes bacterium]|nr:hypothetical protein [Planctomycetota bacterium]
MNGTGETSVRERGPAPPAFGDRVWHTAIVMVSLALVVYLPAALPARFLDFDDAFFFGAGNDVFRDGLAAVFDPSRPIANAWLPVAHASLWLDWQLAGAAPFWAHLHAILLHGLAAIVLVRFVRALGAGTGVAHVVGALFLVHPALAESVAWVSGRKDLLSGLFTFAALWFVVTWCRRGSALPVFGAVVASALAMYAKPTAVVLPFLALLVCWVVPGERRRFLLPLVVAAVVGPIAWHHQTIAAAEGTLVAGSVVERLPQAPGALLHYAAISLWPSGLNVLYPEVDTMARFRAAAVQGTAVALLLALVVAAGFVRPRVRFVAFGVGAFLVALLPFNTAYPGSSIAAADRYLYLAIPGAALAIAAAARLVLGPRGVVAAAALAVPLAFVCGARAHDFRDDEALWQSSLAVEDQNAVAHLNLVYALVKRGPADVAALRRHLVAAVKAARYPVHELRARQLLVQIAMREADYSVAAVEARAAIAAAAAQLARETGEKRLAEARALLLAARLAAFEPLQLAGDTAGAEDAWKQAKELIPDHPDVVAFGAMRDLAAVVRDLQQRAGELGMRWLPEDDPRGRAADATLGAALQKNPRHAGLLCAQAAWERVRDRVLPALRNYRLAQDAQPDCVDAWLGASRLLRDRESFAEAAEYAKKGLAHRPDPSLRQEYAMALAGQGRLDDAILHLEAYMKVRPDDADSARVLANLLVGTAYDKLGDSSTKPSDVRRIVDRALAYNPKEAKAHLVLGRLLRQERDLPRALDHLETAFRVLPDFDDARRQLVDCLADLGYQRILQRDDEGAAAAWLRCLELAPKDFDSAGIRAQLQAVWRRCEARGVELAGKGDRAGAIAAFRRCLTIDPQQHWAAWLLALVLQKEADADLDELERLCRQAVAWQESHQLDGTEQALLLATTLSRRGRADEAKAAARAGLGAASTDAKPQVLAMLRNLAAD